MTTTTHPAELNTGVWTSWLPVTTAWPSNPACNTAIWARYGIQESRSFWPYIYDPAYGTLVANTPTCLPPEATSWWVDGVTGVKDVVTKYSLGPLVCPEAYTTISTSVVSGSSTSVICCPTNFDFARNLAENGGIDGVCTSAYKSGDSLTFASPVGISFAPGTTTFTDAALLVAVPVQGYNFAISSTSSSSSSSSTSSISSSSTSSSSSTRVTGSPSPDTSPSPTGPPVQKSSDGGLSQGAKIGIGIVVPLVILILAGIAAAFFIRRKKRRSSRPELDGSRPSMMSPEMGGTGGVAEAPSPGMREYYKPYRPKEPVEISGQSRPAELSS